MGTHCVAEYVCVGVGTCVYVYVWRASMYVVWVRVYVRICAWRLCVGLFIPLYAFKALYFYFS